MGILRFARNANILENNLVQTAASAGEAVAGGVVYTAPALILLHFWSHFSYWENCAIALLGGLLGVCFSIPLRRVLVTDRHLHFPEGKAIAEVLIAGHSQKIGFSDIFKGGLFGAALEFLQTGLQVVSQQTQFWVSGAKTVWGFGLGYSAPMFGVGYLVGFRVGISLFIGAVLGYVCGVPITGWLYPDLLQSTASASAHALWDNLLEYIGVGAMLTAGIITLGSLLRPFYYSMREARRAYRSAQPGAILPRTERDLPFSSVIIGITILLCALVLFFTQAMPVANLGLSDHWFWPIIVSCTIYVFIIGFIFCAITGYFSGMVGVTASPGSAIIIAGLLIAAIGLRFILEYANVSDVLASKTAAAAITIFLGAIITGAAAIANDNIQDLKVGHIVGATPWKQQIMLSLGVIIAALVIPIVMELLFQVYGIGDVLPREGMDPSQAMPAPPAAMMAAVTRGVFDYNLPWPLIFVGAGLMFLFLILNHTIIPSSKRLSLLGIAMGIYLPLATSVPLFAGGLVSYLVKRAMHNKNEPQEQMQSRARRAVLIACGLVSGAAVMNILLAIPFIAAKSPEALAIMPANLHWLANGLGIAAGLFICTWLYRAVVK